MRHKSKDRDKEREKEKAPAVDADQIRQETASGSVAGSNVAVNLEQTAQSAETVMAAPKQDRQDREVREDRDRSRSVSVEDFTQLSGVVDGLKENFNSFLAKIDQKFEELKKPHGHGRARRLYDNDGDSDSQSELDRSTAAVPKDRHFGAKKRSFPTEVGTDEDETCYRPSSRKRRRGHSMSDSDDTGNVARVHSDRASNHNASFDKLVEDIDNFMNAGQSNKPEDSEDPNAPSLPGARVLEEVGVLFDAENEVSPKLPDKLADQLVKFLTTRIKTEVKKELHIKYKRPENLPFLITQKVNQEIWNKMGSETRNMDLRMQSTQGKFQLGLNAVISVVKDMYSLSYDQITQNVINKWHKALLDGCACFGETAQDFILRRRDVIRPDLKPAVRAICSSKVPASSLLFGDELSKTLKDIKDTQSLGYQVAKKSTGRPRSGNSRGSGGSPRRQRNSYQASSSRGSANNRPADRKNAGRREWQR
jgi:hypothetical protein